MDQKTIVLYLNMKGMGLGYVKRNLMDVGPRIYPSFWSA
jgi:hypothetical protein